MNLDHLLHRKFLTGHFFLQSSHVSPLYLLRPAPPPHPSPRHLVLSLPSYNSPLFSQVPPHRFPTFQQPKYLILLHSAGPRVHSAKVSPIGKPGWSILCITLCIFLLLRFKILSCLMFNAWKQLFCIFFPSCAVIFIKRTIPEPLTSHSQKCPIIF